jgi:putative acetyltransferase
MEHLPRARIADGHLPQHLATVRELFREYAAWLQVDLCFQGFEAELAALPGRYAPPSGAILLAHVGSELAGCVASRALEADVCEMKRLWVREPFRRCGTGAQLVDALIERARAAGHERMRLDTLPRMQPALALYRERGFREIPAYYHNPMADTIYLEKRL